MTGAIILVFLVAIIIPGGVVAALIAAIIHFVVIRIKKRNFDSTLFLKTLAAGFITGAILIVPILKMINGIQDFQKNTKQADANAKALRVKREEDSFSRLTFEQKISENCKSNKRAYTQKGLYKTTEADVNNPNVDVVTIRFFTVDTDGSDEKLFTCPNLNVTKKGTSIALTDVSPSTSVIATYKYTMGNYYLLNMSIE